VHLAIRHPGIITAIRAAHDLEWIWIGILNNLFSERRYIASAPGLSSFPVSSVAQTDALRETPDREGADHPRRVYAEDFGGTGDVSETLPSKTAPSLRFQELRKSASPFY
jgi:hypothetical protein